MGGALLGGVDRVGHARRMLDQGVGVAEADGALDHRQRVHHFASRRQPAGELEGDHAAEGAHLAPGEGVLVEAFEPGIVDPGDRRVVFQRPRHRQRRRRVAVHAQLQGLDPAHDLERRQRRHHRAGHVLQPLQADGGHVLGRSGGEAGDEIAVAAEILGRRMDDDVGAQLDRPGQVGGGVGVVDHRLRPVGAGDRRDRGDVDEAHVRVGRRLEVDHPGVAGDRPAEVLRVAHVDEARRHPELGEPRADEGEGAAVEGLVDDDLVALAQERPQHRADRAHAGGERQRRLGAFEAGEAPLEEIEGRVADAAVEVPRGLAAEHRRALLGAVEGEGRGHVDRRNQRALLAAFVVPLVDRPGGEATGGGMFGGLFHRSHPRLARRRRIDQHGGIIPRIAWHVLAYSC